LSGIDKSALRGALAVCAFVLIPLGLRANGETVVDFVSGQADDSIRMELRDGSVECRSVSEFNGAERLSVFTQMPDESEAVPVIGELIKERKAIRFEPMFPLQAGLKYFVEYENARSVKSYYSFSIEEIDRRPMARVREVFPSAEVLPENLLKFYIHFTHPMSVDDSYRHIRLLNEGGQSLPLPFLELGEELWDSEGKGLTLLFDPGRIKSGLRPRLEEGGVLEEGRSYILEISQEWLDAEGQPMVSDYRKRFTVGPLDTASPRVDDWVIRIPKSGTKNALLVEFSESLDEALLQRVVTIIDGQGDAVTGSIRVGQEERVWVFEPNEAWRRGSYRVKAHSILEDLAGNSIGRPFEVEMSEGERHPQPKRFVYLDFTIR